MQKTRSAVLIFLFLLLIYSLLRMIFYFSYFEKSDLSWADFGRIIYWGCRMDIAGLFYLNSGFFVYYFIFKDLLYVKYQKRVTVLLLSFINISFIAINIIDLAYYKFNLRRSTVDLFRIVKDSLNATGSFLIVYWYLLALFLLLSAAVILVFNFILKNDKANTRASLLQYIISNILPCLFFLFFSGLLARGISSRPILPSTPLLYLPAQYQPLVNNSTVTVLYSFFKSQKKLDEKKYYPNSKLDSLYTINRKFDSTAPFNKKNVVVIILESFAKEYVEDGDALRVKTPFIDSLMKESIVCKNAYSNGLESNKGIVALLASIPPFFDEPYYYSVYSNNNIRGIGSILKEEGYSTSFFMGAGYDHYGFAKFSKMIGIDNYFSGLDYGNQKHSDGNWGIYDHYFLPYAGRQFKQLKKPFFSVVFNLSSHYPNKIPDTLKERFTIKGQNVQQNSISYVDYSLRLFFEEIKEDPWYKNTLFVFSADHNFFWHAKEKAGLYKNFRIPIFFYLPGQCVRKELNKPVQQLDIVPSILDLLHYGHSFMSFGRSVFDTIHTGVALNNFNGLYQILDSSYIFGYDEKSERPAYLYNFKADPSLTTNLLKAGQGFNQRSAEMEEKIKAVIQRFNYSMINNKILVE